jgi:endonuclease-3
MVTPNRGQILNTTFKVLKKHYTAVKPVGERSLLEHLIYSLCLENSPYEKADEVFARLDESFFDWNEVRVTTVTELTEICRGLQDPAATASNVRKSLHGIFESQFSFDLEPLKKENIGKAVKQLEKHDGVTPFAIGYVVQQALGGHAIPIDEGLIQTMLVLGVITPAEAEQKIIPGMERAIPKSKGIEFASLVHQLAADYYASPRSPRVRSVILQIDPEAKARLPKRGAKKVPQEDKQTTVDAEAKPAAAAANSDQDRAAAKPAAKKKAAKKPSPPAAPEKKKAAAKQTPEKPPASKKKKSATRSLAKQKPR